MLSATNRELHVLQCSEPVVTVLQVM